MIYIYENPFIVKIKRETTQDVLTLSSEHSSKSITFNFLEHNSLLSVFSLLSTRGLKLVSS